jgi:hypothetical protein
MEISVSKNFFSVHILLREIAVFELVVFLALSQQIVLSLSVCNFSNLLNKSCSKFFFSQKWKRMKKNEKIWKIFQIFQILGKKTFFRKKKFSLSKFLLLCCAVFLFMHSCTYVLLRPAPFVLTPTQALALGVLAKFRHKQF